MVSNLKNKTLIKCLSTRITAPEKRSESSKMRHRKRLKNKFGEQKVYGMSLRGKIYDSSESLKYRKGNLMKNH